MLAVIINILLFILVIGLLTFIHELGHFIAAKLVKAKVYEFALGFGPKLISKQYKGTLYSIRIIPLGGFVKILGDGDPGKEEDEKKMKEDTSNLKNKPKLAQIFVMLAGVTMNILFAVIVYYIIIASVAWKMPLNYEFENFKPIGATISSEKISEDVKYTELIEGGNAQKANIPTSGTIRSIQGNKIELSNQISTRLSEYKGQEVDIDICSSEDCRVYKVTVSEEGKIGIMVSTNYVVILSYENNKIFAGFAHLLNTLGIISQKLGSMFTQAGQTGDYSALSNTVSGPIGIYYAIDYFKQFGFMTFISVMADLSLSLAIMNILPIPALDGGRVLILLVEGILKKDLDERVEAIIINTSFILLIIFIVFIMIKDLVNIENIKNMFG